MTVPDALRRKLEGLCAALDACAAGYWRMDQQDQQLIQVAFVPGPGLDHQVGGQFAAATRSVALSQSNLGIVAAAVTGQPAISRVEDLPADSGSGRWLRAFGAARSVAVPVTGKDGNVLSVLSVALPRCCTLTDEEVAQMLHQSGIN